MPKSKNKKPTNKIHHKIVMALGIGISVVSFWRGTWGLMDLYLFPTNQLLSSIASLVIGIGILYTTHYLVREFL